MIELMTGAEVMVRSGAAGSTNRRFPVVGPGSVMKPVTETGVTKAGFARGNPYGAGNA